VLDCRAMAVVEVQTFRLVAPTDESRFLDADSRVQAEFIPNRPGFLRRTTARAIDGEWLVVVLWASMADAATTQQHEDRHPAITDFFGFVDRATFARRRYETLE